MGTNVAQILRQGALRVPERVALITLSEGGGDRREHTFHDLDARACRVASTLQATGLRPADRVALWAENSADFVAAWFGTLYAGCELVPVPILSAAPEVAFRIDNARCRAVLCDGAREPLLQAAVAQSTQGPAILDIHSDIVAQATLKVPLDTSQDQPAMILYTSGTTGRAKGATISHGALLSHTSVLAFHALRLSADDTVLGVLPLTHSYGCRMVMLSTMYAGGRAVLLPRFEPQLAMDVMRREQVTWLPAVPTMFTALGNLPAGPQPRLHWAMCAGAPLADETARRAEQRLGAEIRQGFGMTEATIATLNAPPDQRVLGSVGKPVWGIEVLVVDEQGEPLSPDTQGEVWIRGHNMMSGYLDDPEATADALRNGFMRTGDVGRVDADGRLYIVDRIKDLIIRGGNNVYPSEVENALLTHEAIAEVAVVGRPDAYYGEEVVAVVVRKADAELSAADVLAWARSRVAKTKVPREVIFVDALPLGPSGKILKRDLRADIIAGKVAGPK